MTRWLLTGAIATMLAAAPAHAQKVPTADGSNKPLISKPMWSEVSETIEKQGLATQEQITRAIKRAAVRRPGKDEKPTDPKRNYTLAARMDDFVARANQAEVPVLIPRSAASAEATALATGKTYYDFSALYPGERHVTVMGMCAARSLPNDHQIFDLLEKDREASPKLVGLDAPYTLTGGEVGHELTFTKFGCSYKITQNCKTGTCGQESDLLAIAGDLGVINAR